MTITLAPKRTTETKQYVFDWSHQLGDDVINSNGATLAVTSGTVTVSNVQNTDTQVSALIAGGTNGVVQTLTLTITTGAGQTLARDYALLVTSSAVSPFPSTTTKGQIEDMAFEEIGLAGYTFDATSAEQASGLQRLDSLMAMWAAQGLDLGYNFPSAIGGSARADVSGIPDMALDAVVTKLALAIAPGIGKTLSVETRTRMNEGMRAVRAAFAVIPEVALAGTVARGAGVKPWSTWRPFMSRGIV